MPDTPTNSASSAPTRHVLRRQLADRWPLTGLAATRDALLDAWDSPSRGYHDLLHLHEVLARLDDLSAEVPHTRLTVHLAAWFHDAVYDSAPDPEGRSAAWARTALGRAVHEDDVDEVARLVLLTRDHAPDTNDADGVALCDADLAILASTPQRYADYVSGVRREYAHLDDATFTAGRLAVLRDFLAREHVFTSAAARRRWGPTARANAEREVAELGASL